MLQTSLRTLGKVFVVDCRGKIVLGEETAALRCLVKELISESSRIVVNMAEVTHIDSNGIGTLFGLYVSARNTGATIKLAALGGSVKSVCEITKLAVTFETFPTVEEAVTSFDAKVGTTTVR